MVPPCPMPRVPTSEPVEMVDDAETRPEPLAERNPAPVPTMRLVEEAVWKNPSPEDEKTEEEALPKVAFPVKEEVAKTLDPVKVLESARSVVEAPVKVVWVFQ